MATGSEGRRVATTRASRRRGTERGLRSAVPASKAWPLSATKGGSYAGYRTDRRLSTLRETAQEGERRSFGHTMSMSGEHARPSSTLFRSASEPPSRGAKHGRRTGFGKRLRLRIFAYRDVEFLSTHVPDRAGPGEECLLLVHVRKVVGQIHYRVCTACGEGVISGVDIDDHLHSTGLGTRALSHLRSRHPGTTWRSTLTLRATRDLLRRMRIPAASSASACAHVRALGPAG